MTRLIKITQDVSIRHFVCCIYRPPMKRRLSLHLPESFKWLLLRRMFFQRWCFLNTLTWRPLYQCLDFRPDTSVLVTPVWQLLLWVEVGHWIARSAQGVCVVDVTHSIVLVYVQVELWLGWLEPLVRKALLMVGWVVAGQFDLVFQLLVLAFTCPYLCNARMSAIKGCLANIN